MTNETAAKILEQRIKDDKAVYGDKPKDYIKAYEIAIKALKAQDQDFEKKGREFMRPGCGIFHCEIFEEETCISLGGESGAIIYGIFCLIEKVSESSNITFNEVMDTIRKAKLTREKIQALESLLKEEIDKDKGGITGNAREC